MATPRLQPIRVADYIPWKRPDDVRLAEVVRPLTDIKKAGSGEVVILGIPDDRGVAINHGRVGSRHGPSVFRQCFYRLPLGAHDELKDVVLWDLGDLVPEDRIDATHAALRQVVAALHRRGCTVILIGGGHDAAYGGLMGLRDTCPEAKLANVDVHLDVRPREEDGQIGSGTAFRRLIEEGQVPGADIYQIGSHAYSTCAPHFQFAREHRMHLWMWEDLCRGGRQKVLTDIVHHLAHHAVVGVSWDLDSIGCAHAPGVSAPASLGFSAEEALWLAELVGAHGSIRHLELMEFNPKVDNQGATARLIATLAWKFIAARMRNDGE